MTVKSVRRERETTRTLDRAGKRRPLILTPGEREVVALRVRELKREVIPPLLRAMQAPNPDPGDRESYHRATNELDWLLEIAEHAARPDRISGPAIGFRRADHDAEERRIGTDHQQGHIGEPDPGARLTPTTGREGKDGTR
jgi:hypothetical protein